MHNATGGYQAGLKKDDSTVGHIFTLLSITQMHFAKKCKLYHKLHLLILRKAFVSSLSKIGSGGNYTGVLKTCMRTLKPELDVVLNSETISVVHEG